MVNIIFLFAAISILIAIYVESNSGLKGGKNILIGVTIPYPELKNKEVIEIINEFKKRNKIMVLIGMVLFIPISFIHYVSLILIYFFVWIGVISVLSHKNFMKYNSKLMELKRKYNWFLPNKHVVTIDTEVTRLKDKMPVSKLWFIPSIIISIIPIYISVNGKETTNSLLLVSTMAMIGTIIFIIMHQVYSKKATEVYCGDTKVNLACNYSYKRNWTIGCVVAATVQSIGMLLVFLPLTLDVDNIFLFMVSILSPPAIIVVIMYYINSKVVNERKELLEKVENPLEVDNDIYWKNDIYNNPNDPRPTVEKRTGSGLAFNLATKKGRVYFWGSYLFVAVIILVLSVMTLRFDFSRFSLSIENNILSLNAPSYGEKIDIKEIEEVDMIDKIDVKIRTNGVGAEDYSLGYFNVEGYGSCKLFIYNKSDKKILIKLKDKGYIFINGYTKDETEMYYNKLKEAVASFFYMINLLQ